jgi:hypothetical protein
MKPIRPAREACLRAIHQFTRGSGMRVKNGAAAEQMWAHQNRDEEPHDA